MEQGVHPVQVIQLAELLLQDALNVIPTKRADFIFFARRGLDAGAESFSLLQGKFFPSPLSGATPQSSHARLVVTTHPFLNRPP
jgi:hypothetical protein